VAVFVAAVTSAACAASSPDFDLSRARGHIDTLATAIGSRPIGTPANARARAYLVDELQRIGFDVRVQEADAVSGRVNAHVFNIIAVRNGALPDAIALVSHYDSVPQAAGALDDALGVATSLEAARVLVRDGLRHSLFVLITDGEEVGLMGARALVVDADVAGRLKAYLNFDGTGASGPIVLFQAGPGWGTPLSAWAAAAWRPDGGSFATEIYKRLPNDTDFSVLQGLGASGLNFAPVDDSYAYHTSRDVAARVRSETLHHAGVNTIAIVRAIDRTDLASSADMPTFFTIAGRGVVYGRRVSAGLAWMAMLGGLALWVWLTRDVYRRRGLGGLAATGAWAIVGSGVAVGLMVGAVGLLRAVRADVTPWYASPGWFWTWLVLMASAGVWIVGRLAAVVMPNARPVRSPAASWWVTLPPWILLTALAQVFAPAAAFLMALPLLVAVVLLSVSRGRDRLVRLASLGAFAIAALLWGHTTLMLLGFVVPLFGWMSIATPTWLYPALLALAGLMVVPPLRAAAAGQAAAWFRPALVGAILLVGVIVSGAVVYTSAAYSGDRPLRRAARYVQDETRHEAWWEVGGAEAALDLGSDPPAGLDWQHVTTPPPSAVRVGALGTRVTFRAATAPVVTTMPAEVRFEGRTRPDGLVDVDIHVTPRQPLLSLVIQVPRAFAPVTASVAGRVASGWWSAVCVGVPMSGITVRLTLDRPAPEWRTEMSVLVSVPGLPGGSGASGLPGWLSRDRTAWEAQSVFALPMAAVPSAR